ncbi:hypothetical protein AB1E19_016722 [Capra hircus]
MLALSYQGISQQPGGNENFSWKDITLIVFGTGIIVIIITVFCCCIKRYKERDQFLRTPHAVVTENEVLRNKLGKLQDEIDKRKAQYKHAWKNVPLYPDWRKEEFKAVNMTLDAATAHPALLLSEEGRRVSWQESM